MILNKINVQPEPGKNFNHRTDLPEKPRNFMGEITFIYILLSFHHSDHRELRKGHRGISNGTPKRRMAPIVVLSRPPVSPVACLCFLRILEKKKEVSAYSLTPCVNI